MGVRSRAFFVNNKSSCLQEKFVEGIRLEQIPFKKSAGRLIDVCNQDD